MKSIFLVSYFSILSCFFSFAQSGVHYSHDQLNRISAILYPDSSIIQYNYDASGNRTGRTVTSGAKIAASNIASPICSGAAMNIPFSATGNFGTTNTFTAQLSDTSGNFTNPVNIGSLASTVSGTIAATLPANAISDIRYKIRIISSTPELVGTEYATDLTINPCSFNIHAKLFIEGYYAQIGLMKSVIDSVNHPNDCDTIMLELHSPTLPYELLYSDQRVVRTDGTCDFTFSTSPEFGKYFLVLKHRNTLETWSNVSFAISDTNNWMISENPSLIYNDGLTDLGDGHFALYSGDVDQNGVIDVNDLSEIENAALLFSFGYIAEDLTGDGIVESSDYSLLENNLGRIILRP